MSETYLYLNTKDAINATNEKGDYEWSMNWTGNANTNYLLYIDEVAIPNAVYPINTNYDTIIFTESGGGSGTATLTHQNYTGTQLAAEIKTQLESANGTAITYTVTYDSQTMKLTVVPSAGTFAITGGTALHVCGFRVVATTASYTGDDIIRLDGSMYVDLISSIGKSSYTTSHLTNTFYRIPIQSEIGSMIYYQQQNESGIKIQDSHLSRFSIRLRDDRESSFGLPQNCQVSLTLRLKPMSRQ
jgi:hypothetical protein